MQQEAARGAPSRQPQMVHGRATNARPRPHTSNIRECNTAAATADAAVGGAAAAPGPTPACHQCTHPPTHLVCLISRRVQPPFGCPEVVQRLSAGVIQGGAHAGQHVCRAGGRQSRAAARSACQPVVQQQHLRAPPLAPPPAPPLVTPTHPPTHPPPLLPSQLTRQTGCVEEVAQLCCKDAELVHKGLVVLPCRQ